MYIDPIFGIEIEIAVNPYLMDNPYDITDMASDAGSNRNPDFFGHGDPTINPVGKYNDFEPIEIVSRPFQYSDCRKLFNNFRMFVLKAICEYTGYTLDEARSIPFNKIFNINKSMGCHIHVTPLKRGKNANEQENVINYECGRYSFCGEKTNITSLMTNKLMGEIRANVHYNVASNFTHLYNKFNSNYFRSYSQQKSNLSIYEGRTEFNLTMNGGRFEYRSFNLNGVETWEDFDKMIMSNLKVIKDTLNYAFKRKRIFTERISI